MKNRAIWVALAVLAAAAALMFFVVLPQLRGDRTTEELARKAAETAETAAKQAKDAAEKTLDTARQAVADKVGEVAADLKTGTLAKMARLKADTSVATAELQALLAEGKTATPEQIAAAKTKLVAALTAATAELKAPEGLDAATGGMIAKAQQGAAKALAAVEAMPTDAEGARKAFEALKSALMGAFDGAASDGVAPKAESASTDAKPADVAAVKRPAFDVLRVEPDGSTVIAGSAEPGTKLDIVDGGKVIASTEVGPTGDFAAVLDDPLGAGDHEITLQATGKDGKSEVSEEIATVSVPKDNKGELLAMVTKPGEASRIMAMPEAKTAEAKTAEAKTPDAKTPEVKTQTALAANTEAKPAADTKAVDVAAADAGTTVAKTADGGVADAGKPADAIKTPELPAASSDLAATAPSVDVAATPDAAAKAGETSGKSPQVTDVVPKASDAEASTPAVQAVAAPEVQVSAVEIEGSKLFVAGSAKPNTPVRVYADDKLVAEVSTDKNGRFVADATMPLAVGNHTIRADVLSADGARVAFRASVPFFRPEGEQLAAVAGDPSAAKAAMTPLADGAYDKAREEAGKAVDLLKDLYKDGKTPSAEELAAARSSTEFALKTLSEIRVPVEVDAVAKDMAAKASAEAAKALALLNALPQDAAAVKQALGSIDQAVTSATAPSMQAASDAAKPNVETADADGQSSQNAAIKVDAADASQDGGDTGAQLEVKVAKKTDTEAKVADSQASAKSQTVQSDAAADAAGTPKVIEQAPLKPSETSVIIRRGDTLWHISRRVYGQGVRYTTIYLANEGQIADPDKIMPGQIFGVPDQPLPNAEELHRKRLGVE